MVGNHLHEAIESLSLLRMRVLRSDPKNPALRASFREISHHMESIQQQRPVAFDEFSQLASWLGQFLDADFGAKIRHYNELNNSERAALIDHINERRDVVMQAEHTVPALQATVSKCLVSLNHSPDERSDLDKQARLLARVLKNHLQDDDKLRKAVNALITAMQSSLEQIGDMLSEVGEDSPELAATQAMLEQELPEDPVAAKELLQKARKGLLLAGKRVSQAGQAIQQTMESHRAQMQQMSENLNRAEYEAMHDSLTGLGNRRKLAAFMNALGDKSAAFLLIDIDHFKKINDRYGHDAGDEILAVIGQMLTNNVRSTDLVVRLGGEEFAAILPDVPADHACEISETLRQAICAKSIKCHNAKVAVSTSIGLATRKDGESIAHWIQRADKAVYEAKTNGRNRTEVSLG